MGNKLPNDIDLMMPTLEALKELGGSGNVDEIFDWLVKKYKFSEEDLSQLSGKTGKLYLPWVAAWARTRLKNMDAVENPSRGIWALKAYGEEILNKGAIKPFETKSASFDAAKAESTEQQAWQVELLNELYNVTPADFEKLCQRLLREAGFIKVEVTGRSGDGGIDGHGILRVNLVSFNVVFQSKRYKGSVGAPLIQQFRGAMAGRGEKGLMITTGNFTPQARIEANRGSPTIDLIDGEILCGLLKQYGLGLKTEMVEQITINPDFFKQL